MKQKDLAVIFVAVIVSAVFSFIVSGLLISPAEETLRAEEVDPISADFSELDERYFNKDAVNPTKRIEIGASQNAQPFEKGQ